MRAREIISILLRHGFTIVGQKGSHLKLKKEGKITIVPIHGAKDLPLGTVKAIEKQTG